MSDDSPASIYETQLVAAIFEPLARILITARWSQAKPWKPPCSLLRNSRRPLNSIYCCAA